MRLVVNSNRIIAALVKDSYSRKIILHGNLELFTILVSEMEVQKYRQEILQKTRLSSAQLELIFEKLNEKLILLPDRVIENRMKEAKEIMDKIDRGDTPFIAAALATQSGIWSDDRHFEKQKKIRIWKTKDLMGMLGD